MHSCSAAEMHSCRAAERKKMKSEQLRVIFKKLVRNNFYFRNNSFCGTIWMCLSVCAFTSKIAPKLVKNGQA